MFDFLSRYSWLLVRREFQSQLFGQQYWRRSSHDYELAPLHLYSRWKVSFMSLLKRSTKVQLLKTSCSGVKWEIKRTNIFTNFRKDAQLLFFILIKISGLIICLQDLKISKFLKSGPFTQEHSTPIWIAFDHAKLHVQLSNYFIFTMCSLNRAVNLTFNVGTWHYHELFLLTPHFTYCSVPVCPSY